MEDEEAVKRCRAGDDSAFRVLYERYYWVLYGTAYLMTRDRSLTEELVQEAFFNAWKGLGGFRQDGAFRPWLLRILVNQVLAHQRRRVFPIAPLDAEIPSGTGDDPTYDQVAREDTERRLLDALPDNDLRQVVLLRYYGDLTILEIAETLGWPEGTVKSRLHRAMALLKEAAGRAGDTVGDD